MSWYCSNCVDQYVMLTKLEYGFEFEDPLPYGWINENVFSYDAWYLCGLLGCNEESMDDGHYDGQQRWPIECLKSYRRRHGILPIWSQLCTGWNWMAGINWIIAGKVSWLVNNVGQRGIMARDRLHPEMDCKRWILSGNGSWQDMNCHCLHIDHWRWMRGDGSQEMNYGRWMSTNLHSYKRILRLCKDRQIQDEPGAQLDQVWY